MAECEFTTGKKKVLLEGELHLNILWEGGGGYETQQQRDCKLFFVLVFCYKRTLTVIPSADIMKILVGHSTEEDPVDVKFVLEGPQILSYC